LVSRYCGGGSNSGGTRKGRRGKEEREEKNKKCLKSGEKRREKQIEITTKWKRR
jgi:hypothetical protein